jgi:hypothetical protein
MLLHIVQPEKKASVECEARLLEQREEVPFGRKQRLLQPADRVAANVRAALQRPAGSNAG